MSESENYKRGMKIRRDVLGDAHVDRATATMTDFDADFQTFIAENAWGSVWSRPHITRRERSMLTIALLAAGGHLEEVALHARAAKNTGATMQDLCEVMMHVAVYTGVPAANAAIARIKKEYAAVSDRESAGS